MEKGNQELLMEPAESTEREADTNKKSGVKF